MSTSRPELAAKPRSRAAAAVHATVEFVKPPIRAVASMVSRHPEAIVGAVAGYAVGDQLDKVWLLKRITGRKAKYVFAFVGGLYGYQMALQRRSLDQRDDQQRLRRDGWDQV